MILLTPQQYGLVGEAADVEKPGAMVLSHVIQTGNGSIRVDRRPEPRAIMAEVAGNYALSGDPRVVSAGELQEHIKGFISAPPEWLPALESAFGSVTRWERIILELKPAPRFALPAGSVARRLTAGDAQALEAVSPSIAWLAKTWGGPAGLASSGYAWGAFAEGRLVSAACTFFVGRVHEDLAVATEPGFERRGLSSACAGALCEDMRRRGRRASWSTSPDNIASLRVAEKLGFTEIRRDWLHVVGVETP